MMTPLEQFEKLAGQLCDDLNAAGIECEGRAEEIFLEELTAACLRVRGRLLVDREVDAKPKP